MSEGKKPETWYVVKESDDDGHAYTTNPLKFSSVMAMQDIIECVERSAYDKAIEALKVVNQMLSRYEECAESDSILKKGMSLGVYTVIKREIDVLKELGELA